MCLRERAKAIGGEIISADSMQVYRYMDLGSAKIRMEEMQGVPHHLIAVLSPFEEFHVVKFKELAREAMEQIYDRGKIPILTGGTGFYIQAVLYDIDFTENGEDQSVREELEALAREKGASYLHRQMCIRDSPHAAQLYRAALNQWKRDRKKAVRHRRTEPKRDYQGRDPGVPESGLRPGTADQQDQL